MKSSVISCKVWSRVMCHVCTVLLSSQKQTRVSVSEDWLSVWHHPIEKLHHPVYNRGAMCCVYHWEWVCVCFLSQLSFHTRAPPPSLSSPPPLTLTVTQIPPNGQLHAFILAKTAWQGITYQSPAAFFCKWWFFSIWWHLRPPRSQDNCRSFVC